MTTLTLDPAFFLDPAFSLQANKEPDFKADPIPPANHDAGDKESQRRVIDATVSLVERLMDADSKAGPLKRLQGHVWREAVKGGKRIEGLE